MEVKGLDAIEVFTLRRLKGNLLTQHFSFQTLVQTWIQLEMQLINVPLIRFKPRFLSDDFDRKVIIRKKKHFF